MSPANLTQDVGICTVKLLMPLGSKVLALGSPLMPKEGWTQPREATSPRNAKEEESGGRMTWFTFPSEEFCSKFWRVPFRKVLALLQLLISLPQRHTAKLYIPTVAEVHN